MIITARVSSTALVVSVWLAGCAGLPGAGDPPGAETGVDGAVCVGAPPAAVPGLVPATNPALQARAQLASGQGGVCAARVFAVPVPVHTPVTVYRVYDSANPRTQHGGWWSLTRPTGARDDYRARNAICREWSALDRLLACQLKPGAEVVLGTTQSVGCGDGTLYPRTADVQVYMANDARNGVLHVENCREEGAWP
ncbi:MAG: hypothetical protein RLZZ584_122 [Pseudomonadota bacterium]|jgi:hypothetical protein